MASLTTMLSSFHACRIYRLTGGVIGGGMGGAHLLLLTTTGRKTGKARTTPLRYIRMGDDYLIVGSNWGKETPPAWLSICRQIPVSSFK